MRMRPAPIKSKVKSGFRVVLASDGTVRNVFPIKSLSHGLTESVMEAARQIKFQPAVRNGQPVSQFATFVYEFKKDNAIRLCLISRSCPKSRKLAQKSLELCREVVRQAKGATPGIRVYRGTTTAEYQKIKSSCNVATTACPNDRPRASPSVTHNTDAGRCWGENSNALSLRTERLRNNLLANTKYFWTYAA